MSRNLHRGMTALALTAALVLAGAAPAAARGLQFGADAWQPTWSWLEVLWTGFFGAPAQDATSERPQAAWEKSGMGFDPNGYQDPNYVAPDDGSLSTTDTTSGN